MNKSKKALLLAVIGNTFEYYDFMLYSFFVSILAPLFFPHSDPMSALLSGFVVFAMGFAARPVGAIVFGLIGDRWGRRRALSLSLLMMAIPTCLMGLLPTYDSIGVMASIGLALLRILQGLAAGGEVNGAGVYAVEQAPDTKKGLYGALLISSAGLGALLATGMGSIFTSDFFGDYGWRIPFILGGLGAMLGVYFRRHLEESQDFLKASHTSSFPLKDIILSHPLSFMKAIAVGGFIHVPFYVLVGFINPVLNTKELITSSQMMMLNSALIILGVSVIPLMGRIADLTSPRWVMQGSAVAVSLMAVPLFYAVSRGDLFDIALLEIIFLMVAEGFIGPSNAYLNSLFPPAYRYSGVAVGSTLGTAILAGTTPLVCSYVSSHVDALWGPVLFVTGAAAIGFMGVFQKKQPRAAKAA